MFNCISLKGGLSNIEGFNCDGIHAGLKPDNALDMAFIKADTPAGMAYVFTTNKFKAAPLKYVEQNSFKQCDFILINAKNANAMTGQRGIEDIKQILTSCKERFDVKMPIMSSTGVIGVPLPKEKILKGLESFDLSHTNSTNTAKAIMTTDSYHKEVCFEVELNENESFKIAAIAKGAGMIDPSMATMLCFILTDAKIPQEQMKPLLQKCSDKTFNAVSVDGDRSTNDSVFLLSSAKNPYDAKAFEFALTQTMQHLAFEILKDGEGATKVVSFNIYGAKDDKEAEIAAKKLSNSLLVKTALFGEDPNWGRIASTIGSSGIACSEESLKISFDNILVYDKGTVYFDEQTEAKAAKVMTQSSFSIHCDLGIADGSFTAYGCDLGYEYVKINADYRT